MAISRVCSLTDDHSVSRRVRRAPHAHGASSRDSRDVRGFRAWRVRLLCEAHETDHRGRPEPFPWKGIWLGLRIGRAIDGLDPDAIANPRSLPWRFRARQGRFSTLRDPRV